MIQRISYSDYFQLLLCTDRQAHAAHTLTSKRPGVETWRVAHKTLNDGSCRLDLFHRCQSLSITLEEEKQ